MTLSAPSPPTTQPSPAEVAEAFNTITTQIEQLRSRYPDTGYHWWAMNFLWETTRFVKHVLTYRDTSLFERVKQSLSELNAHLHPS